MDTPRRNPKPVDVWLINAMNSILNTDKFSNMIRITVGDLRSRTGNADKRRRNTAFAIPISRNRYGNYSGADPIKILYEKLIPLFKNISL